MPCSAATGRSRRGVTSGSESCSATSCCSQWRSGGGIAGRSGDASGEAASRTTGPSRRSRPAARRCAGASPAAPLPRRRAPPPARPGAPGHGCARSPGGRPRRRRPSPRRAGPATRRGDRARTRAIRARAAQRCAAAPAGRRRSPGRRSAQRCTSGAMPRQAVWRGGGTVPQSASEVHCCCRRTKRSNTGATASFSPRSRCSHMRAVAAMSCASDLGERLRARSASTSVPASSMRPSATSAAARRASMVCAAPSSPRARYSASADVKCRCASCQAPDRERRQPGHALPLGRAGGERRLVGVEQAQHGRRRAAGVQLRRGGQQRARRVVGALRRQQQVLAPHRVGLQLGGARQAQRPGLRALDAQAVLQRVAEEIVQAQRAARVVDHAGEEPAALDLVEPARRRAHRR